MEGAGIVDAIKALIYGRREYSPAAQRVLVNNYYDHVARVEVRRHPLADSNKAMVDLLTLGQLSKKLQSGAVEDVWHISAIFHLKNGTRLTVEKTEQVMIFPYRELRPKEQRIFIDVTRDIGFGEWIEQVRKQKGDRVFHTYHLAKNNCGSFITYLLQHLGLYSEEAHKFIFQDTERELKPYKILDHVANTAVRTIAAANYVTGNGLASNPWLKHVSEVRRQNPDWTYKQCLIGAKASYRA